MKKNAVDLLIKDATIYTVDDDFTIVEALVVKDGKILDSGSQKDMLKKYKAGKVLSLEGKYVYPGWNDAHCHFVGYGLSLNQVDLAGTGSVNEVLERCKVFAANHPGSWITGRGWDQNDWEEQVFPDRYMLDEYFPQTPVILKRIDGHAAWVNSAALKIAGITKKTVIEGGEILMIDGAPSGILVDNAIELMTPYIPQPDAEETENGILKAQENCFSVGLTSVSDAGLPYETVQLIRELYGKDKLKMRINVWLEPSELNFRNYVEKGIVQDEYITIRTVKLYADGALGSRGARMLEDYNDDPGNRGLLVTDPDTLKMYCRRALDANYQVAVHCIGDEANRTVLHIYKELLEPGNDRRWRIEHSQVIHQEDFSIYGEYNIVPSVQPTHATSDMYWVEDRIGKERMKGAYSYKTLMEELGWIPNGSDFPVEDINPLYGFYAAVARKDKEGYPNTGFIPEEALSREEALRAMTCWAAKAAFEEAFKGSLESGKLADFVVTDKDIMSIEETGIPGVKIYQTWLNGELVYEQ